MTAKQICLIIFLVFSSSLCKAEDEPMIIYFGGAGTSQEQMNCWEQGAEKITKFKNYKFKAIAYPLGASSEQESVLSKGADLYDAVANVINRNPKKKFILVGHSSGAALANKAAELVKDSAQIELFDLDGFVPSKDLQKKVKTTCVHAINRNLGIKSKNANDVSGKCVTDRQYIDYQCKTEWCLHYSLVNKSTPPNLNKDTAKREGYLGCETNLDWLEAPNTPGAEKKVRSSD